MMTEGLGGLSVLDAAREEGEKVEWLVVDTTPDGYGVRTDARLEQLVEVMQACLIADEKARMKLETVIARLGALRTV